MTEENKELVDKDQEIQAEPDVEDVSEIEDFADVQYNERLKSYTELIEKRRKEKEEILPLVKEKYKGVRMFSITLPYNGTYVIKAQEMSDTRVISDETEKFVESEFQKYGGRDEVEKMSEKEKNRIFASIDAKTTDLSNDLLLKRCVLYPFNIKEMIDSTEPGKNVPIGAASILLERIVDVSGWQDVIAEEV